ncbi:MAG: alternative ribosome rescue aminoacyl-tRNA hydrolase ArfB [Sphingobacteriaceae bacterium]
MEFLIKDLLPNIRFKTSRSGGKGGQNVNKVSTKVELNYNFASSDLFDDNEKNRLKQKLNNKMTSDGFIQVISEEERSQYLNKERALQKLVTLISNALHVHKPRKATKPNKMSIEKRLKNKQQQAVKKLGRSRGSIDF